MPVCTEARRQKQRLHLLEEMRARICNDMQAGAQGTKCSQSTVVHYLKNSVSKVGTVDRWQHHQHPIALLGSNCGSLLEFRKQFRTPPHSCMKRAKQPRSLPDAVDVLIVGAGPHALAMASRLLLGADAMADVIAPEENFLKHRPCDVRAHLKKVRRLRPEQLAVVDCSGAWMKRWRNQFQALNI
eukprot:2869155-Amphidinium_carterae.1